jgi:hypothetical protein
MNARQQLIAVFAGLLIASGPVAAESQMQTFEAAWEAAEAARQQAAAVSHEWRDTALFLEQAKALAAEGDYDAAMKQVKHAQLEGERGVEQAEQQARIWQDAVPK